MMVVVVVVLLLVLLPHSLLDRSSHENQSADGNSTRSGRFKYQEEISIGPGGVQLFRWWFLSRIDTRLVRLPKGVEGLSGGAYRRKLLCFST
jgi:hypothetical protein